MADAAGLAVGLVSLGIQVANGITKYIDALNCRDTDIASVRHQNESLQTLTKSIEASLSGFQENHEVATDAVHKCLGSSEKELSALQSLLADLTAYDESSESRKDRFKRKGRKLLYPFSRPKVEQLETKLANANVTLQLAQQSLQLSVSQLGVEKLAALEMTSQTITFGVHTAQSTVSSIRAPLQDLSRDVSGIGTRVECLEALLMQVLAAQPAAGGLLQRVSPSVTAGRLLGKPSLLKDVCDAAGMGAKTEPGPSKTPLALIRGATRPDETVSTYTGGRYSCICRNRRRLRLKNTIWGSFRLSFEEATEKHLPGCPAIQVLVVQDQSQKLSLTYTGLQCLLSSAIKVSFDIPWGAGAGSLCPTFTYYPSVDSRTAPAFRILSLIGRSIKRGGSALVEAMVASAVATILNLLRAKKASPRAVDVMNRSLIHYLALCIRDTSFLPSREVEVVHRPLPELLECLLVNKAPANDYDLTGRTMLGTPLYSGHYSKVPNATAAAELILRENVEENVACRFVSCPETPWDMLHGRARITWEHVILLSSSIRVAEGNLDHVDHLVRNHPATLAERNLFGCTPLHLAANQPSCLRRLVEVADTRLLNQKNTSGAFGKSALEFAIALSRRHCRSSGISRMCQRCGCAECTVILLKADCAVPVGRLLQIVLHDASKRCKLIYIRHLKDRRDRLKQLALDSLPDTQTRRLGLESDHVLDALALQVTQLLDEHGVPIPDALAVSQNEPSSVYEMLQDPEDAELFFRAGFHDTDSWCESNVAELEDVPDHDLEYLHWLAMHGASSCQLKSFTSARDILIAHTIFRHIGRYLEVHDHLPPGCTDWIHELHSTAMPANTADSCYCKCSLGGCTPLTSLLKGLFRFNRIFEVDYLPGDIVPGSTDSSENGIPGKSNNLPIEGTEAVSPPEEIKAFTRYFVGFGDHLGVKHHIAALRKISQEDTAEVEDEHKHELACLEELLAEFEGEVIAILQDPDREIADLAVFWERTWVRRTWEVLNRLEGSDLGDEERREAEEIGVVWDRPQPVEVSDNPYDSDTEDYFMYELKKIEAECE